MKYIFVAEFFLVHLSINLYAGFSQSFSLT